MPNKYFSGYNETNQQKLYKDLIDECIKLFGIATYYIPRQSVANVDVIFGDDPTKYFSGCYPIDMYVENVDQFEGDIALFSKFGLINNKQLRLLVSNVAFQEVTSGNLGVRPREGDIIWMRNFQALFEIKFVNQDKFFYAFGSKPFYGFELVCEEFRYNQEIINSGLNEVDEKVNEVVIAYQALVANGTNTYLIGETVYQGANLSAANATANVVSWNLPTGNLVLTGISGIFINNANVIGVTSNASWMLLNIEVEDNVNDLLDNNVSLRDAANTDLDLSEGNPIQGDPITSQDQEW